MALSIDQIEVVVLKTPRKNRMAPTEQLLVRIRSSDGANGSARANTSRATAKRPAKPLWL